MLLPIKSKFEAKEQRRLQKENKQIAPTDPKRSVKRKAAKSSAQPPKTVRVPLVDLNDSYDFDLKEPFPDSDSEEEFAVEPSGSTCRNKRMCVRRLDADILEALWATDVESSGEDAVFDESEEE